MNGARYLQFTINIQNVYMPVILLDVFARTLMQRILLFKIWRLR